MRNFKSATKLCICVFAAFCTSASFAQTITIYFTGNITSTSGDALSDASTISGTYNISADVLNENPDASAHTYKSGFANPVSDFSAEYTIFDVSGVPLFSEDVSPTNSGFASVNYSDYSFGEHFSLEARSNNVGNLLFVNLFSTLEPGLFSDSIGEDSLLHSILGSVMLEQVTNDNSQIRLFDGSGIFNGRYSFEVTSLSTVPIPAAAWLFLSALGGLFGWKRIASVEGKTEAKLAVFTKKMPISLLRLQPGCQV